MDVVAVAVAWDEDDVAFSGLLEGDQVFFGDFEACGQVALDVSSDGRLLSELVGRSVELLRREAQVSSGYLDALSGGFGRGFFDGGEDDGGRAGRLSIGEGSDSEVVASLRQVEVVDDECWVKSGYSGRAQLSGASVAFLR